MRMLRTRGALAGGFATKFQPEASNVRDFPTFPWTSKFQKPLAVQTPGNGVTLRCHKKKKKKKKKVCKNLRQTYTKFLTVPHS